MRVGYFASGTDIHDQKIALQQQIQLKLIESRAKWHEQLANSIPVIVWIAERSNEQENIGIGYFNRKWTELTGMCINDNNSWEEALHPADRAAGTWRSALSSLGTAFELKARLWRYLIYIKILEDRQLIVMVLRASDNTYRQHLIRALYVVHQDQGDDVQPSSARWFGTAIDIDDQVRAEKELIKARNLAETAVTNQVHKFFSSFIN